MPTSRTHFACALISTLIAGASPAQSWPAEPWTNATDLTAVEGPGTNDFHQDLSGAFYSPATGRLWLCRNGPSDSTSKVWSLVRDGSGSWVVETRAGGRCEWTGFGDAEALTQVDPASNRVLVMVEGEEVIREFDLATPGVVVQLRTWNTAAALPVSGSLGSEGLAFVPDGALFAGAFTDPTGNSRRSLRGMGGLVFVGHQNGGRIYVFDLSPTSTAFDFVGSFATSGSETAEVTLDPITGDVLLLHGDGVNQTEIMSLASIAQGADRKFVTRALYQPPAGAASLNLEGLALADLDGHGAAGGQRSLFLAVDDGGAASLRWFRQWPGDCRPDIDGSGAVTVQDLFQFLALYFSESPRSDFNRSASITVQDVFDFLAAFFQGC